MAEEITIIGSSNVDLVMKMDHLPAVGETVSNAEFMQTFGGKGANQAVAAARAGGAITFVNCVGDDPYSKQMVQNFQDDGMDTSHVHQESGVSSGTALIMVGESGNNYISIAPGANYLLTPQRVDEARELIGRSAWVLIQYEIEGPTVERVLQLANEVQTPVVFNFAPAREFPSHLLRLVHTLVVNENEAATLAGVRVETPEQARDAARTLTTMGPGVVIVTLGAAGSVVATAAGAEGEEASVRMVEAFPVEAVDTTAAGDTYCGCLVTALGEGQPLENAVRFASAGAALSVRKMGAQSSTPYRREIDEFLKQVGG